MGIQGAIYNPIDSSLSIRGKEESWSCRYWGLYLRDSSKLVEDLEGSRLVCSRVLLAAGDLAR